MTLEIKLMNYTKIVQGIIGGDVMVINFSGDSGTLKTTVMETEE